MKKLLIILIAITALTEGCKKYEEGPCFSLRSAYGRFGNDLILVKYTVNGVDSLSLYNDSLSLNYNFYYHYDEDEKMNMCLIGSYSKDSSWSEIYWHWKLIDKNKKFKVYKSFCYTGVTSSGTGPFGTNKLPEWEIIELKYNDIKMKTNYNGKEYQIELKSS